MRTKTQDPKYDIEDGKLIVAATGEPIPEHEPVFLIRAKDWHSINAIDFYGSLCNDYQHKEAIRLRKKEFEAFSMYNDTREPDTDEL